MRACVLGHLVLPHLDGGWVCSASARMACFTARMVAVVHFKRAPDWCPNGRGWFRDVDRAGGPDRGRDGARGRQCGHPCSVTWCCHLDGGWVCNASARMACFTARHVAVNAHQNGVRPDVAGSQREPYALSVIVAPPAWWTGLRSHCAWLGAAGLPYTRHIAARTTASSHLP